MMIDPRGHPPSIPVIAHPRAAQHQAQHAGPEYGCRSMAMVVVAMMMAMAFAGKGRARQAGDKGRRERIRAPGPKEDFNRGRPLCSYHIAVPAWWARCQLLIAIERSKLARKIFVISRQILVSVRYGC